MVKIDKDYVEKLFKWLEEHEEIDALLNENEKIFKKRKRRSGKYGKYYPRLR